MPKKIAIMQPYFFPYLGYYQLIATVDEFIFLDDVNFIKGGWINRNQILLNGQIQPIRIQLHRASQNRAITEIERIIDKKQERKLFATIQRAYGKATYFKEMKMLLRNIFSYKNPNLANFLTNANAAICEYLEIHTSLVRSSECCLRGETRGAERILQICKERAAKHYINPRGGQELYDRRNFQEAGIKLSFLHMRPQAGIDPRYREMPAMSILHLIANHSVGEIRDLLKEFDLR